MKRNESKTERENKKRKDKKKSRRRKKRNESNSSDNSSGEEQEWVERSIARPVPVHTTSPSSSSKKSEPRKREDWMNMESMFPRVQDATKKRSASCSASATANVDKCDFDKLGRSDKELNPYWKNGGNGLPPCTDSMTNPDMEITDANWLKKSLLRARQQAEEEGRSLEEVARDRWGSLEVIRSMISNAERASKRHTSERRVKNDDRFRLENQPRDDERYENDEPPSGFTAKSSRDRSIAPRSGSEERRERRRENYNRRRFEERKEKYRKPIDNDCFVDASYQTNRSGAKRWQRNETSNESREKRLDSDTVRSITVSVESSNSDANDDDDAAGSDRTELMSEAEMNKLGAKIVKAEIMGNAELAAELKLRLQKARELSVKTAQSCETEDVILSRTDRKGVARPLECSSRFADSSERVERKNRRTHTSGKRVRHYFDDDNYSLEQLFRRERGRSTNEDEAAFVKSASKNVDMDDAFEEQITRVRSGVKQSKIDRSSAIGEHQRLSKSLDGCRWCIDSKYMSRHMIVTMDSEICLSLPPYASLTDGHCILTPVQHVACQLRLDENVWEKLKAFKRTLYEIFKERNEYPVFYEIYKNRKFSHMRLECIPLPKEIGELAPMYFKKALLECETEWSMNKKVIDLERKDVRQVIPNGLSYFMVEFETNKGYAHVIEDERMFPKNFAEEIIGGMLDLDHDVWRKPKKENFDQQREKVLKFSDVWKKHDFEATSRA
ncbi:CWF19-like protein 2 [Calliopsis andreniformis]|uniref:CWF19-like protein 2 n=1 Tax=Calliopsis andreniformis TaxID=337506 RepID=UPI003FCDDCAB